MQNEFDSFSGPVITIEPGRLERERLRATRVRRLVTLLVLALAAFTLIIWLMVRIQSGDSTRELHDSLSPRFTMSVQRTLGQNVLVCA